MNRVFSKHDFIITALLLAPLTHTCYILRKTKNEGALGHFVKIYVLNQTGNPASPNQVFN